MTFAEIWQFNNVESTYFGPGVNAFTILQAIQDLRKIDISYEKEIVKVRN